jgi:hypothetical protein
MKTITPILHHSNLSPLVQEIANTTRERAVKYLNFSLGKSAHCPQPRCHELI